MMPHLKILGNKVINFSKRKSKFEDISPEGEGKHEIKKRKITSEIDQEDDLLNIERLTHNLITNPKVIALTNNSEQVFCSLLEQIILNTNLLKTCDDIVAQGQLDNIANEELYYIAAKTFTEGFIKFCEEKSTEPLAKPIDPESAPKCVLYTY